MNTKRKRRMFGIISIILIVGVAIGLILYALKQNINLFYTPTQLAQTHINSEQTIRIGGYVKKHSVQYDNSGQSVHFIVTDNVNDIAVNYHGVLPNLFREGQGIVITGKLSDTHTLQADQVLAKHDEKYMPWTLNKALKRDKNGS